MRGYLIIGTALALAITPAMAGSKGGGGGHASTNQKPAESATLNYGSVKQDYKPQTEGTITHRKAGSKPLEYIRIPPANTK
ncbi:MAG TPA: hypothetical protein VIY48_16685 [Candidatus Paceibacterota bacterium]